MMELAYDLLVSACTAIVLSFIVAKLLSYALGGGEVGGGKGFCAGVDTGVEEGKLEKRLRVDGLKSGKKRVKDVSGGRVFVSEFKGKTEPAVVAKNMGDLRKADDVVDDRKELGSVEKDIQFLGMAVDMAYLGEVLETSSCDQVVGAVELSRIPKEDDHLGLGRSFESESRVCSYDKDLNERVVEEDMVSKEVGCSIEGFDQETNSVHYFGKLFVHDDRRHYQENDVVEEEMASFDFTQKEDGRIVGRGEEDSLKWTANRGVNVVDQDEGTESTEPKKQDNVDVGLVGGENGADNQDGNQRIFEENQWKDQNEGGVVDQVDDQHEEIKFSVSKENVFNRNKEGRVVDEDKGEMEISDGEDWEGIERNELERDFTKAVNFVECRDKEGQLNKLGSDVLMQLHGLQKVVVEGPYLEPQPIAQNLSARANWNSWRKSGSMNQEEAMEKYITLLSDKVPGWMDGHPYDLQIEGKENSDEDGAHSLSDANSTTPLTLPLTRKNVSKPGEEHFMGAVDLTRSSSSVNKNKDNE